MNRNQPLKQILISARGHWDRPEIRPAVRENFEKMINCRTPALGAEVFASETGREARLPQLQIEVMPELWAMGYTALATGAVECSPRHPLFRHGFYDAQ